MVDESGLPDAINLDASGRNDRYAFGKIVEQIPKDSYLAADKGYDCKKLRRYLRHKGLRPLIPRRQFENKPGRKEHQSHTITGADGQLNAALHGWANLENLKSTTNITGKTGTPSGN